MALRIIDTGSHADTWADFARPWDAGRRQMQTPIFARSHAYSLLIRELKRYLQHQIRGRSFLISGHRGSGKTSLVLRAVQDMQNQDSGSLRQRPLLVKLHGPSLLAPINQENKNNDDKEGDGAALAVLVEITIALYRALSGEVARCYRDLAIDKSVSGNENDLQELAGQLSLELDNAPGPALLREFWDRIGVLKSGVLWPYRDERERMGFGGRWLRWDSLGDVYRRLSHEGENDQGIRELVAISTAAQAFQVVSGSIEYKTIKKDNSQKEEERESSVKLPVKEIANSLIGLVAGALAGGAAIAGDKGTITSIFIGLITALAAGVTLSWSTKRKRQQSISREHTFIRKREVTTLDRELPIVIERIRAAGLAPVFVVDELDKVDNLVESMAHLVQRLKHLVADYSFFCFLTDRDYFEYLHDLSQHSAYPKEHTYFSHRLFVLYQPSDLHEYLENLIKVEGGGTREEEGKYALSYLLLHRAMLHTFDLQRELAKVCDDQGAVIISTGELRTELGYRYHIMIQLAIEILLSEPELRDRLNQDPQFGQVAYDALYMPTRTWLSGEPELDLSVESIECYLRDRLQPGSAGKNVSKSHSDADDNEKDKSADQQQAIDAGNNATDPDTQKPSSPLSGLVRETDRHYLTNIVRRLAEMLANPNMIIERLSEMSEQDARMASLIQLIPANEYEPVELADTVNQDNIDTASDDQAVITDSNRNPLIRKMNDEGTLYHWCRDPYGRNLLEEKQLEDLIDVEGQKHDQVFINEVDQFLNEICGTTYSPAHLAELGVLKTVPDWEQVKLASERLAVYHQDGQKYDDLIPNQEALREYAEMLMRRGRLLGNAIIAGKRIGHEAGKKDEAEQVTSGIEALSVIMQLPSVTNYEETENRINDFLTNIDIAVTLPVLTRESVEAWSAEVRKGCQQVNKSKISPLDAHRNNAWQNIYKYIESYLLDTEEVIKPGLDEATCVAADVMPPPMLMKPCSQITIFDASLIIKLALQNVNEKTDSYVPLWVTIPFLHLLGLNQVINVWQRMLTELIQHKYFNKRKSVSLESKKIEEISGTSRLFTEFRDIPSKPTALVVTLDPVSKVNQWRISSDYGAFLVSQEDLTNEHSRVLYHEILEKIISQGLISVVFIDLGDLMMQKNAPMLPVDLPESIMALPTFHIASTPVYEGMVTGRVLERSDTLDEAMSEALASLVESS